MIRGLPKAVFNQMFRFRDCRKRKGTARCELCAYNEDGYCVHPKRLRRIRLSTTFMPGHRLRFDSGKVCDEVVIIFPSTASPHDQLQPGQAILIDDGASILLHGNPECPYIAAWYIDDQRTDMVRLRDTSAWSNTAPYCLCELPACRNRLQIKPGRADYYLKHLGYDDGYVQPKIPTIFEDDLSVAIPPFGLHLVFNDQGTIRINWTDEALTSAVRFIKRLIQVGQMEWRYLEPSLRATGWGEVADIIRFEKAVLDGQTYCIPCGLKDGVCYHHPSPLRVGAQPYCPNPGCSAMLTNQSSFMARMPQ